MSTVRVLLPALGVSLAFTLGPGEKLVFEPQPGSSVTKIFTLGGDFSLDRLSLIVEGQDVSQMMGEVEMSMKTETRIEVTDVFKSVAGGRATELLRTFEALGGTVDMEISPAPEEVPQMVSSSELEGETVVFRWNEEKQEYELSFQDGSGDEELLEDLEADMDLRVFLPEDEVAPGDSWTVELAELQTVVMPGGNLRMLPADVDVPEENLEMFEELFASFGEEFADLFEGECKCTFQGTRDEGGVRVGEIVIELQVACTLDLSEFLDEAIRAAVEQSGVDEVVEFSIDTADLSLDFDGSGTLLWNLAAGHAQAFQLGGDATMGMDFSLSVEAEGNSQDFDASLEMSGSMREELATKE